MDFHKDVLFLGGGSGPQADKPLQRQAVQGHEAGHIGVAEVQIGQAFTAGQTFDVRQLIAVGQLQPGQLFAVFEAHQLLHGAAGGDEYLDIGHVAHKGQICQIFVVADIHIFDILAVAQVAAGVVGHVVNGPDGVGVGQGVVAVAYAEVDPPDHLRLVPVVLPDPRQDLVVQLAVVQQEAGAVVENIQSLTDLFLSVIADAVIFVLHGLVGGGQGLAEEGEAVAEGGAGVGILEPGHIRHAQRIAQLHPGQIGQKPQLRKDLLHPGGIQIAQIQLCGIGAVGAAQQLDGVIQIHLGIGFPEGADLLRVQPDVRKRNGGKIWQVLQVLQQQIIIKAAGLQGDAGGFAGHRGSAQSDGIGYLYLGMGFDVAQDRVIAGAGSEIHGFEVGILIQSIYFSRFHLHRQLLYQLHGIGGGHRVLGGGGCGQGDDFLGGGNGFGAFAAAVQGKGGCRRAGDAGGSFPKRTHFRVCLR